MPAGLEPQFRPGDVVNTPDGPGHVVAIAAVAYYSEHSDIRRAIVVWQHNGQEYPGAFIVQLTQGGEPRGYTWPQLAGLPW